MTERIFLSADPNQDDILGDGWIHKPCAGDIGKGTSEKKIEGTLRCSLLGFLDDESSTFGFNRSLLIGHRSGCSGFYRNLTCLSDYVDDFIGPAH